MPAHTLYAVNAYHYTDNHDGTYTWLSHSSASDEQFITGRFTNYTLDYVSGNVTKMAMTAIPPDTQNEYYDAEFYSTANPFYRLEPPTRFAESRHYDLGTGSQPQLRKKANFGVSSTNIFAYSEHVYTYRADGYPLSADIVSGPPPYWSQFIHKFYYVYQ